MGFSAGRRLVSEQPPKFDTLVSRPYRGSGREPTGFVVERSQCDIPCMTADCSTGLSAYRVHTKEEFTSSVVCDETTYQPTTAVALGRGPPTQTALRRWKQMSSEERSSEPIGTEPRQSVEAADRDTSPERGSYRRLRDLFEEVTGTETIIEEQESAPPSRCITDDPSGATISEYVGSMVRDDGLGETLAEPDTGSAPD